MEAESIGKWDFDFTTGQVRWDEHSGFLFALPANRPVSFEEILSRIHPEDTPVINTVVQAGFDPAPNGSYQLEFRVIWPDGSVHRLLGKGEILVPGNGDRQPVRITGTILNPTQTCTAETALVQSQKRFRDLVETVNDWVWEVDQSGAYTYSSPKVRDLLGYEPEEVIGKTPFDFMPEDEKARVGKEFGRVVAERGLFCSMENANRHKDGHLVVLETSGVPFFDENGILLGYRGIDRDITERKRLEFDLLSAKQAAEEANCAKSMFLANVSHELRTPMTAIIGVLELLKGSVAAPDQRQLLEMADSSASRLLRIIDDLIDISMIEAQRLTIEDQLFDLRNCVRQAVEKFTVTVREKELRLYWEVTPQLPAQVAGDAERLGQILVNLIGNAVKFTNHGGEIMVTVVRGANGVLFKIRDSGIGIPAARLGQIFEPFTQADNSMTRCYGGTGLGLAICKNLVEMMGGTIWGESVVGQGSTFTFTLPLSCCAEP